MKGFSHRSVLLPSVLLLTAVGCRDVARQGSILRPGYNVIYESRCVVQANAGGQIDFENDMPGMDADALARTDIHHIDGTQSLRWAWSQPDASLEIRAPVPFKPQFRDYANAAPECSTFSMWLYNETPYDSARLRIEFGKRDGESPDCWFHFGLNFSGWRLAHIKFRDMEGKPAPGMDYVRLRSPQGVDRGRLFIDALRPVVSEDVRWAWPDYQMPEIESGVINQLAIHKPRFQGLRKRAQSKPDVREFARIREKLLQRYRHGKFDENRLTEAIRRFQSLKIVKDSAGIRGTHVGTKQLHSYLDLMFAIARLHGQASTKHKPNLAHMYVLMAEHLLDQGWAEGSALNAQHHFGYKSRNWAPSVLLMRDELRRAGLLQQTVMAIIWFGRDFCDMTAPYDEFPDTLKAKLMVVSADYLNTIAYTHLITLVLLDDTQLKSELTRHFKELIERLIVASNGGMKSDGCFFHHRMHYAGYGLPALRSLAQVIHALDGTSYEISIEAWEKLRHAFLMVQIWAHPRYGFNACGRHPLTGKPDSMKHAFRLLAESRPGTDHVDEQLAAAYLGMWGGDSMELFGQPIERRKPQGSWSMNYAASGLHKCGSHSVILKGHQGPVRSHETYRADNRFGRYQSHGTMMIMDERRPDPSGFVQPGWDWAQPPGATTLALPHDLLEGSPTAFYGSRVPQVTPFSGSSHLEQKFGVFAFRLDTPANPHDQSIRGRTSVVAAGPMLICLGSGISNGSDKHSCVTTLFQRHAVNPDGPVTMSWRRAQSAMPFEAIVQPEQFPVWMVDEYETGYFIPPNNPPLRVHAVEQHSRHNKTKLATAGPFAKAWFDHAIGPKNSDYEYVVLLGADEAAMEALSSRITSGDRPYSVLLNTDAVHAVSIAKSRLVACTFFEVQEKLPDVIASLDAGLVSVDKPCFVMSRKMSDKQWRLSVCYPLPALGRPAEAVPEPVIVHLTVNGTFEVVEPAEARPSVSARHQDGLTLLAVETFDARPTHFDLRSMD